MTSDSGLGPRVFRWWFENRETGAITVAQRPNWPILAWLASLVVARATDGRASEVAGWAGTGLLVFWGLDELVRGVNPWRRLLGAGVIAWQAIDRLL